MVNSGIVFYRHNCTREQAAKLLSDLKAAYEAASPERKQVIREKIASRAAKLNLT